MSNKKVIISVPGPWPDKGEIVEAVTKRWGPRFQMRGMTIVNTESKQKAALEIYDFNEHMEKAFEIAGQGKIDRRVLEQIAKHKQTVYLMFDRDDKNLRSNLSEFARVLEEIGGYAVKVETSGVAHEFSRWHELLNSANEFYFYMALVTLVGMEDYFYSCGMHNFGLPDCCMKPTDDPKDAAYIMNVFNMFLLTESPEVADGHTFNISNDTPSYNLTLKEDFIYQGDDFFGNPFGRWVLEQV